MTRPLILLVDDDPDFLDIHRCLLEANGYDIRSCASPQDAWACLAAELPALVITDLMMQDLNAGFSLARRIKTDARTRAIPVIIITAVSAQRGFDFSPRHPDELAAMGADAFFDKPVDPAGLLAKIGELMGPRRAEGTP